jgi:hypothetical protein
VNALVAALATARFQLAVANQHLRIRDAEDGPSQERKLASWSLAKAGAPARLRNSVASARFDEPSARSGGRKRSGPDRREGGGRARRDSNAGPRLRRPVVGSVMTRRL